MSEALILIIIIISPIYTTSKGKGVKIFMIDSGCRATHQVKEGRKEGGYKEGEEAALLMCDGCIYT